MRNHAESYGCGIWKISVQALTKAQIKVFFRIFSLAEQAVFVTSQNLLLSKPVRQKQTYITVSYTNPCPIQAWTGVCIIQPAR